MTIPKSKWKQNDFFKEAHLLAQIGMMSISPIGFQYLPSHPGIFSVTGGLRNIVFLRVIPFQVLRLGLRVDKNETAFLALNDLKAARNSEYPVLSFKKKAMLVGPTNFASNRFHCLNHLLPNDHTRISIHHDPILWILFPSSRSLYRGSPSLRGPFYIVDNRLSQ